VSIEAPPTTVNGPKASLAAQTTAEGQGNYAQFQWIQRRGEHRADVFVGFEQRWDYSDASGTAPTLPGRGLVALGIDDDGLYTIALKITDGNGAIDVKAAALGR